MRPAQLDPAGIEELSDSAWLVGFEPRRSKPIVAIRLLKLAEVRVSRSASSHAAPSSCSGMGSNFLYGSLDSAAESPPHA